MDSLAAELVTMVLTSHKKNDSKAFITTLASFSFASPRLYLASIKDIALTDEEERLKRFYFGLLMRVSAFSGAGNSTQTLEEIVRQVVTPQFLLNYANEETPPLNSSPWSGRHGLVWSATPKAYGFFSSLHEDMSTLSTLYLDNTSPTVIVDSIKRLRTGASAVQKPALFSLLQRMRNAPLGRGEPDERICRHSIILAAAHGLVPLLIEKLNTEHTAIGTTSIVCYCLGCMLCNPAIAMDFADCGGVAEISKFFKDKMQEAKETQAVVARKALRATYPALCVIDQLLRSLAGFDVYPIGPASWKVWGGAAYLGARTQPEIVRLKKIVAELGCCVSFLEETIERLLETHAIILELSHTVRQALTGLAVAVANVAG